MTVVHTAVDNGDAAYAEHGAAGSAGANQGHTGGFRTTRPTAGPKPSDVGLSSP